MATELSVRATLTAGLGVPDPPQAINDKMNSKAMGFFMSSELQKSEDKTHWYTMRLQM